MVSINFTIILIIKVTTMCMQKNIYLPYKILLEFLKKISPVKIIFSNKLPNNKKKHLK